MPPRKTALKSKAFKKSVQTIAQNVLDKRSETKFHAEIYSSNPSVAPEIIALSNIILGDTLNQRDGNRVDPIKLHMKYTWTNADTTNICRFIVFRWLPINTTPPAASNILTDVSDPRSELVYDKRNQFNVLYDKTVTVATTQNPIRFIEAHIPLRSKIQFTTVGSATGSGMIYGLLMSDSGAVTHPAFDMLGRLTFKDL